MQTAAIQDWLAENQRHLMLAVEEVRCALEQRPMPNPVCDESFALDRLCAVFQLTPFERHVLLLCAAVELDSSIAKLCAAACGEGAPTFSLAMGAFPDPHWSALVPDAALRRWRLVEVGGGANLTASTLRIDERVLHYLTGTGSLDERLNAMLLPLRSAPLAPSQQSLTTPVMTACRNGAVVELYGEDLDGKRAVVARACEELAWQPWIIAAEAMPISASELNDFVTLWSREVLLQSRALVIDGEELDWHESNKAAPILRLLERYAGTVFLLTRHRQQIRGRRCLSLEVPKPPAGEQRELWKTTLGHAYAGLNGGLDAVLAQFHLSASAIESAGVEVVLSEEEASGDALWEACRRQARPKLDDLAQRIETFAEWDDLVLPDDHKLALREIAAQVRQRNRVYTDWGFAEKSSRGLGISALFGGPSGTGKTMAAEVLARELRLDLYRIDLSQVISKYIGETEKSLRRVFDAAEDGGAVLLFDEADALFGKRSEVKDSHDRYANIEVSYLLQRMECYRGLAILTTNMKTALDPAFLRRIRFIVQFPFPDAALRTEIWRRAFPPRTPTHGLDFDKLARLNFSGGSIRNVALAAAFLAADEGSPVRMSHLARAARRESEKTDRVLTDAEIGGWQ